MTINDVRTGFGADHGCGIDEPPVNLDRERQKQRLLNQLENIEEDLIKKPRRESIDAKNKSHFENKKRF